MIYLNATRILGVPLIEFIEYKLDSFFIVPIRLKFSQYIAYVYICAFRNVACFFGYHAVLLQGWMTSSTKIWICEFPNEAIISNTVWWIDYHLSFFVFQTLLGLAIHFYCIFIAFPKINPHSRLYLCAWAI